MAGYFIYSLDADAFQQLTTAPTMKQCQIIAEAVVDDLESALDEYDGRQAADTAKWPTAVGPLAAAIQKRLAAHDWYADLTMGDAAIWDGLILRSWEDEPGEQLQLGFECENDGDVYWDVAKLAARRGASMMAEPAFGNAGFRYSGASRSRLQLAYTLYPPADVERLRDQLEQVAPHFESLPDDDMGTRAQFFDGLLEPVRKIAAAGRVMWVQTDT